MARTVKDRREAYDNIAIGSAVSSRERTINGGLPPDFTTYGNTENVAVGSDYGQENQQIAVDVIAGERLGA